MTKEQFDKLVEEQFERCREVLGVKAKYYERIGTDRLAQFERVGAIRRVGSLNSVAGMMVKHTDKLYDCITRDEGDIDVWNEVITDHINYLLLLKGVLIDSSHLSPAEDSDD